MDKGETEGKLQRRWAHRHVSEESCLKKVSPMNERPIIVFCNAGSSHSLFPVMRCIASHVPLSLLVRLLDSQESPKELVKEEEERIRGNLVRESRDRST